MQDILTAIYGQDRAILPQLGEAGAPARKKIGNFIRPGGAPEALFSAEQVTLFQKRTAVFIRKSFPAFAKSLTDAELEKLAIIIQKRAGAGDFTTEREIWHYLIAVIYCGFFFEQDLQYADMLNLIGWNEYNADKMLLLDRLLSIIDEYAQECEKDYTDFGKKLQYLAEFYAGRQFAGAALDIMPQQQRDELGGQILTVIYPHRQALWTAPTRRRLIELNLEHVARLGFGVKEGLVYAMAAIYFGRGFEQSPLYPWAYFLQNRNIPAPERIQHFTALLQKHFMQIAG